MIMRRDNKYKLDDLMIMRRDKRRSKIYIYIYISVVGYNRTNGRREEFHMVVP